MCFNFVPVVTIRSDFGAQENKISHCFHCFPIYLPWSDGIRCHDCSFFHVANFFKPIFSLSSLILIKRLFSSSSPLSAIRVVSSAYWRLLTFHLETLIPACNSHNLAFCKMCSACVPACVLSRFSRVDFQGVFPTQGSNPCLMSPALAGRLFAASAFWEALYSCLLNSLAYLTYKLNRQGDKYSLDILLKQFWTILLFYGWFCDFLTCIKIS